MDATNSQQSEPLLLRFPFERTSTLLAGSRIGLQDVPSVDIDILPVVVLGSSLPIVHTGSTVLRDW